MEDKSSNKKKKIIYILFPIFVIATIVELVLLLNPSNSNKELKQNSNNGIKSITEPNYDEEMTLGDILYNSTDVSYNNSNSGLTSTNVKAAIDELYTLANRKVTGDYVTNVGFTNTNTANTVFANSNGVCIVRKGKLSCFKKNYYTVEKLHIKQVFNGDYCFEGSYRVYCSASDFYCDVYDDGLVKCCDISADSLCQVSGNGSVECS